MGNACLRRMSVLSSRSPARCLQQLLNCHPVVVRIEVRHWMHTECASCRTDVLSANRVLCGVCQWLVSVRWEHKRVLKHRAPPTWRSGHSGLYYLAAEHVRSSAVPSTRVQVPSTTHSQYPFWNEPKRRTDKCPFS